MNISWIVQYKEQVEGQKKEEGKPIEIEEVEEWEIKKILNKRKIRGVERYLVQQKGFTAEHNSWVKREELGNAQEVLEDFEGRMEAEIRRQEKLDRAEEKDFRRRELSRKSMTKMLYGWDDGKFEDEYLKKLERNWNKCKRKKKESKKEVEKKKNTNKYMKELEGIVWTQKYFSGGETLKGG